MSTAYKKALTSVGFVIASLMMAKLADRLREGQWLVIGFVGMAIAGMAYSFTSSGAAGDCHRDDLRISQRAGFDCPPPGGAAQYPREMRGRVNSAFFVSRDILFLIGMLMAGLADVINIRVMYFFSAALVLVGGIMTALMTGLGVVAAERRRRVSLAAKRCRIARLASRETCQPGRSGGINRLATDSRQHW